MTPTLPGSSSMADEQSGETEPIYLTLEDVLGLYGLIIGAGSAEAADHLRNREGLESALARPATYAHYEDADLALQATVLAHGIAEGQLFIDGNKRTALVAMLTFLEINGWRVEASDPELADWILSFSAGAMPEDVAKLLRLALLGIE
jgi:death-on-curing protein